VGFLPPEELVLLQCWLAKIHFDQENLAQAIAILEQLAAQYSVSDAAPEAIYLLGVCNTKALTRLNRLRRPMRDSRQVFLRVSGQTGFPHRLLGDVDGRPLVYSYLENIK
jgi:hypothetical protein